jgi:hypothetical protein
MSTAEPTNVLATADLEPTMDSKEANAAEKTSDITDASKSASALSAEPSVLPTIDDSCKSSPAPADDTKVEEEGSKEANTSASVESENAEKIATSPAKEDAKEEIVNKGTESHFSIFLGFLPC